MIPVLLVERAAQTLDLVAVAQTKLQARAVKVVLELL
jgi:hypothetical protein